MALKVQFKDPCRKCGAPMNYDPSYEPKNHHMHRFKCESCHHGAIVVETELAVAHAFGAGTSKFEMLLRELKERIRQEKERKV